MDDADLIRLATIRRRLRAATSGPWRASKERQPLNDLGHKTFPEGVGPEGNEKDHHESWRIDTTWEHGQLRGPYPVVTTSYSPYFEPNIAISIRDEDVDLIANAPEDIFFLLELVERLQTEGRDPV